MVPLESTWFGAGTDAVKAFWIPFIANDKLTIRYGAGYIPDTANIHISITFTLSTDEWKEV
jgi:hypothetical protein